MRTDILSLSTFAKLAQELELPLVSVCLPLHVEGNALRENQRLARAALSEVEQKLAPFGLSPKGCSQFLAPARAFAEEQCQHLHGGQTLLLLCSPSLFEVFLLEHPHEERIVVGSAFYVTPLLQHLHKHAECYVLTASKKRAQLHHMTDQGIGEMFIEGMPASFEEAWKDMEKEEESLQFHSTSAG